MAKLTDEQQRKVASLVTNEGYRILTDVVITEARDTSLWRLRQARNRDEVLEAAFEFRAWEKVMETLRKVPKEYETELKEKGDFVYGV